MTASRESAEQDGGPQIPQTAKEPAAGPRLIEGLRFALPAGLCIAAVVVAIYASTFHSGFLFDDRVNITRNPFLRWTEISFRNLMDAARGGVNDRPVADISFALNYYFGRYQVEHYHAVNIAIHIANGWLVFALARLTFRRLPSLTGQRGRALAAENVRWAALAAALFFVAHPLQTQSVSYIVQRMTSLAAGFYLAALLLYLAARNADTRPRRRWLAVACACAGVLALGSKQNAVTLPVAIALYEWFFYRDLEPRWLRRQISRYGWPLFLAAAALYKFFVFGPDLGFRHRDFTAWERLLTQFRVLVLYLGEIVYPDPSRYNLAHDVSTSHSLLDPPTTAASLLLLLALLGVAVAIARSRRLVSFGILWFFLHHAVESSILPLEMVYEHRNYLPLVGLCWVASFWLFAGQPARLRIALPVAGFAVIVLATASAARNEVWKDGVLLWTDVASKSPALPRAQLNLSVALARADRREESLPYLYEALRLDPDFADAHTNLGITLLELGRPDEALIHYERGVELEPNDNRARAGLGNIYQELGRLEEAATEYETSLKLYPNSETFNSLGSVRHDQGRLEEAAHYFSWALETDPQLVMAQVNLGNVLVELGEYETALAHLFEALAVVELGEIHAHIGNAYWSRGQPGAAIHHLQEAQRLEPEHGRILNNLAWMLATCPNPSLRDPERAMRLASELLQREKTNPGTVDTLAVALAATGRFDEAIRTAELGIEGARALEDDELAREIESRIALYRAGTAYVEEIPAPTSRASAGEPQ